MNSFSVMSTDTSSINFDVGLFCNIFAAVLVKNSWNVATEHFFSVNQNCGERGLKGNWTKLGQ